VPRVTPKKDKKRKLPRIVEIAQKLGKKIPEAERQAVPPDFSSRLDEYIYRSQKH
jgi:hypothetical protein